jgi:hypothetical protein
MVKTLITNKVTAIFTITLGKPIAYAMHALPTAVSRFMDLALHLAQKSQCDPKTLNRAARGIWSILAPSPFHTWSKRPQNLVSASLNKKRGVTPIS